MTFHFNIQRSINSFSASSAFSACPGVLPQGRRRVRIRGFLIVLNILVFVIRYCFGFRISSFGFWLRPQAAPSLFVVNSFCTSSLWRLCRCPYPPQRASPAAPTRVARRGGRSIKYRVSSASAFFSKSAIDSNTGTCYTNCPMRQIDRINTGSWWWPVDIYPTGER